MGVKYDRIGTHYNQTRRADPFIAKRLYQLLSADAEGQYLEIGCGTGNYTHALVNKGLNMMGLDPSTKMLNQAKSIESGIDWKIGTAEKTDLPDDSIDGIVCVLTIHHWTDLKAAFRELSRILKVNGRVVIFTSNREQTKGYWLNHYFPKMMAKSIQQLPAIEDMEEAMRNAGLRISHAETYVVKDDLRDHFLYCGKNRPMLYFNEEIRAGISSFADLANEAEVLSGLQRLEADIKSTEITEVMKSYSHNWGDYLFLVARS